MATQPRTKNTPVKKTETAPKRVVRRTSGSASTKPVQSHVDDGAYIPSPDVASRYVHRKIFGVEDFKILASAMKNKRNVLLMGDTGAGKTMVGEAFASSLGVRYYSLPCDVSIDPTALFGKMIPTETPGKFEWQDGPVTDLWRHGGVLNISEINFMPPKIAASLYPALDGRRYLPLLGHKGEVVRAHDDLLVIADMNPQYRGTHELNAAFKNRFSIKVQWGYDSDVEAALVKFPTLRNIAGMIRDMVGTEIMTPVTTNALMEFETFASDLDLGLDFALGNFVAGFSADERQAVEKVFELNRPSLAKDLAYMTGAAVDDDDFEEFDYSSGDFEAGA